MQMSMKINQQLMSTPLPNFFIDNYMSNANPIFSLIYIYIYKKCMFGEKKLSLHDLTVHFNILEIDVINSLLYWQSKNLIAYTKNKDNICVEFLVPKFTHVSSKKKFDNFPSYTMQELNVYKDDPKIQELFDFAQESFGRYLTYSDLNTIFGFYDYLRLPLNVIQILIAYCSENGHRNLPYIEKVAIDWATDEIDSVQKAEEKIIGMNELFYNIKKALAVNNLNEKQREFFTNWKKNFSMPDDLLVESCNVTMMNIGRANYNYINSVLKTWHKNDIRTLEEAKNFKLVFNDKSKTSVRKNRFANFEQRNWDFEKIERLAQED